MMHVESGYSVVWDSGDGGRAVQVLPAPVLERIVTLVGRGIVLCQRRTDGAWGIGWPEGLEEGGRTRACVRWPESTQATGVEHLAEIAELVPTVAGVCRIVACPSRWCRHAKADALALSCEVARRARGRGPPLFEAALLGCRHPTCADSFAGASFHVVATRRGWMLKDRLRGGKEQALSDELAELADALAGISLSSRES